MNHFTDVTGLAGIALALAVVLSALFARATARLGLSGRAPALIFGGLLLLMLLPLPLPLAKLPLAAYLRGMIGDLSMTSLLLLAYAAAHHCGLLVGEVPGRSDETRARISLLLPVLAAGAFYPLALGVTQTDPYRWGYGEPWFLAALLLVAIIGNLSRLPLVAASISLAVLAWAVGWYESTNLWDYLIDPLLCLYALGVTSRPLLSAFAARRKPAA